MIITSCAGGLGNQMFQYAFGKTLAEQGETPLWLDLTWYHSKKRKFLLDEFKVTYDASIHSNLKMKLVKTFKRPSLIKDTGSFQERTIDASKNILLAGHWESWKYFEPILPQLRTEFVLKHPSAQFASFKDAIKPNSISVHIRRGDYLVPHGKVLNGKEYCEKAVAHIIQAKKLNDPDIMIFSDDPEWCRNEMAILAGCVTHVFPGGLASDAEELMLMSNYSHNVIGNSTFSWWAAFLNSHSDKIVVMPENWFTETDYNARYRAGIEVPGWKILS
jgi:hypothetical protein